MNEIRTRIHIGPDHQITGTAPAAVPAGTHIAAILIEPEKPARRLSVRDLPVSDLPWDNNVSLRRQDIYGDDGR